MSLWKFWLRRRSLDVQLDSELRFHLDHVIEEKTRAGLTPEDARREAMLEFGGREQVKEELRDLYRIATLEKIVANLKSGIRLIRKSPSVSIAVILTLGLGIGANSAVFSAINAILLRPMPFLNSDELVRLQQFERATKSPATFVAPVRLEDWNRLNSTFQTISGWYTSDVSETTGALPEKVTEALVAPRFLQVWGVSPALGRDFTPEEEHFGGPNAVLISDRYWRRRFQANPKAIGRRLRLEKRSATIVGVMAGGFLFPDHDVDVWTTSPPDAPFAQSRESTWFNVVGRLKPGVRLAQAKANLTTVQTQLGRQFPKTDSRLVVDIQPLKETTIGSARRSLWVLFGSVSLLLLIACTNIAALLLARTTEREREISVRFSLGASRPSIVAQLLTECFVLAFAGSALGLLAAAAGSKTLRTVAKSLPRAEEITLDWRIVLYTFGCAVLATLLCGLIPAIRGTRSSISGELARASRTQVSTRSPLQWLLVGIQVALAVTLLAGAGLLLRSFEQLGRVSPGFEVNHILTFRISGNWGETADMRALTRRIDNTLDQLRAVPGVVAAATADTLPGILSDSRTEIKLVEGRPETEGKIFADNRFVSNGYFAALNIPVLQGEGCRESANYFGGVTINRSFANTYLHGLPALGHHLQFLSSQFLPQPAEIRGIVGDAREQGLNHEPEPTVYWCVSAPTPTPYFLIQTRGEPLAMANTLRQKIQQLEPARSVYEISPLDEQLSDSFAESRLRTTLLSLFALTAVALVCVGLYGTMSYFVTVRKREVGLRLALGAIRSQIVRQFLIKGIAVAMLGCFAGLCLSIAFGRGLSGMLYGVSSTDLPTLASVVILIFIVAAVASLFPSLRAAQFEPMQVLRDE